MTISQRLRVRVTRAPWQVRASWSSPLRRPGKRVSLGHADGDSFECSSFDQLPDAERAAIDADAAACQEQLAAYLWRKHGMAIAEGELQVRAPCRRARPT